MHATPNDVMSKPSGSPSPSIPNCVAAAAGVIAAGPAPNAVAIGRKSTPKLYVTPKPTNALKDVDATTSPRPRRVDARIRIDRLGHAVLSAVVGESATAAAKS
jgi:hypothetical protein